MDLKLGAHFSTAGGLHNALYAARDLQCNAAQIFTKNARTWKEPVLSRETIDRFKAVRNETCIEFIASHCTYLINIANQDEEKRQRSENALKEEMKRSEKLGLDGVVLHPGAHLGCGVDKGLDTAGQTLKTVLAPDRENMFPHLLIETTAGMGTSLGSSFQQIGRLLSVTKESPNVGVCLDTSHVFAAGYDLRDKEALHRTLDEFEHHIGLDRLMLIHLNDSAPALGSRKDRHAHIGHGQIGAAGFLALMTEPALEKIPKIIETPKELNGTPMDPVNLSCLRQFAR